MLFVVVHTHAKGKRRTKVEMAGAEQFMGELSIDTLMESSAGRPIPVASLKDPDSRIRRDAIIPLLDVRVVKLTSKGMHLVGYQIEAEGGQATEYVQGWWAKFLLDTLDPA